MCTIEFLDCFKRERVISIKAMLSGGNMAFRLSPALNLFSLDKISYSINNNKQIFIQDNPPVQGALLPKGSCYKK